MCINITLSGSFKKGATIPLAVEVNVTEVVEPLELTPEEFTVFKGALRELEDRLGEFVTQ